MCDDAAYFLGHIDEQLRDLGLEGVKASDIASVIEGYKGRGYGLSTDSELSEWFGKSRGCSCGFGVVVWGETQSVRTTLLQSVCLHVQYFIVRP